MNLNPPSGTCASRALCFALVGASLAAVLCGCDVRGVPFPGTADSGLVAEDTAGSEVVETECVPGERVCDGPSIKKVCDADGSWQPADCPATTSCESGSCKPIETHCDEAFNSDDSLREFSVSPRELIFETDEQFKSSTASLDITNCSNEDILLRAVWPYDPNQVRDTPVFTIQQPRPQPSEPLPAGSTRTVTVRYAPQYAFSREKGKLNVELQGSSYRKFHVDLIPKTYCVTATPEIAMGVLESDKLAAQGRAVVQNCGTEPVEIEQVNVEVVSMRTQLDATFALDEDLTKQLEASPLIIDPGEHLEIPFSVDTASDDAFGTFAARVVATLDDDDDKFPSDVVTSDVTGRVVPPHGVCRDEPLEPPTVWTDRTDETRGWRHVVDLDETVHFDVGPMPTEPYLMLQTPEASRARLRSGLPQDISPSESSFTADVAGVYKVQVNHFDDNGVPLCTEDLQGEPLPQLVVEVEPSADFYVDLQWVTDRDFIPHDVGYGRGADLNLHLNARDVLDESTGLSDFEASCYGYGELPLSQALDEVPEATIAGCNSTSAQIHALSVSGAHREIMTVDHADKRFYYIGVSAFSMYDFPRGVLRLNVYADGEPVDDIEVHDPWWPEAAREELPDDLSELLSYELGSNEVWVFGVWDAEQNRLLPRPPRRFERSFP